VPETVAQAAWWQSSGNPLLSRELLYYHRTGQAGHSPETVVKFLAFPESRLLPDECLHTKTPKSSLLHRVAIGQILGLMVSL